MRTIQSLKKQEARLRKRHTQQTSAGEWASADTTRRKLIATLDQIKELESAADQALPKP